MARGMRGTVVVVGFVLMYTSTSPHAATNAKPIVTTAVNTLAPENRKKGTGPFFL
jgi:hypothetical protein